MEASKICGCFYCLSTFAPSEIEEWIKNDTEEFAMCPSCGIDSVIGDASGIAITDEFLREMNNYWFNGDALAESEAPVPSHFNWKWAKLTKNCRHT